MSTPVFTVFVFTTVKNEYLMYNNRVDSHVKNYADWYSLLIIWIYVFMQTIKNSHSHLSAHHKSGQTLPLTGSRLSTGGTEKRTTLKRIIGSW